MSYPVPALARICVLKIVKDIKDFCPGVNFGDLGKYHFTVGPFQYLCESQHINYNFVICRSKRPRIKCDFNAVASRCIEMIFDYVISTGQLDSVWLCLLIVNHLRTIDFTAFPSAVNVSLFKMLKQRCKVQK